MDTFFGRYRGSVVDNQDPLNLGRLRVNVPDVLQQLESTWALPSMAITGSGMGIWALPSVGANIWVEFEQGDVGYAVWTGGWWANDSDVPTAARADDPSQGTILVQTHGGTRLLLSDAVGSTGGVQLIVVNGCSIVITDSEIKLVARSGASIVINDSGIILDSGTSAKITLQGPSVSVNDGALTVT